MKPGWKTTEFGAMVAAVIGSVAFAAVQLVPPRWAALVSAIAVGAYTISRGLAKINQPTPPPPAEPPPTA